MTAYYNEYDPGAAEWLRQLIHEGIIAPGDVDARSITEVQPSDIKGYTQAHFFAGVGGWSYALRLAGWSDDTPVWTGSAPCQPFSIAGKGRAESDERHLWPEFARLIGECGPPTVFGEQVASPLGRKWLLGVFADLEGMGYAAAGADLCAAGVGAPQIRQRLYWMGVSNSAGRKQGRITPEAARYRDTTVSTSSIGGLGYPENRKDDERRFGILDGATQAGEGGDNAACASSSIGGMGHSSRERYEGDFGGECSSQRILGPPSPWSDFDLIPCRDGKTRRVESGSFPLVDGFPERVGLLRGYGNAIVPEVAAEFIQAAREGLDNGVV